MLILTLGLVTGGIVCYVMVPTIPGDFLKGDIEMVDGTADWQTRAAHDHMLNAIYELEEDYQRETGSDTGFIRHVYSWGHDQRFSSFMIELTKSEARDIDSDTIVQGWHDKVGEIAGAEVLSITNADDMGGPSLGFKLVGPDFESLKEAANELSEHLESYEGIYDIRNGGSAIQDEITLSIKPGAEALGLSLASMAKQVREAFYGAEAQRIQRGTNEVKVMVRYPREERSSVANLEGMYIRTNEGDEIPISSVAELDVQPGYSKTTRINSEQAVTVSAAVNKSLAEPEKISKEIIKNYIPQLQQRYPGLNYKLDGESEESGKLFRSLFSGFALALFGIYTLLAVPLKSYLQPLIIMGVIPFGIIGAVVGHIVIGIPFDMMSFFGVIALSGVVVNDSLIMVDFVNKSVADGVPKHQAILHAGSRRFRAILLTSLTTFFGLLPILLEQSVQAQLVIPMAVSLGFGIVFATVITLLLVPCLYMVLDDFDRLFSGKKDLVNDISANPDQGSTQL